MQHIVHKHIENVLLRLRTTFKVQQRLLRTKKLLCLINTVLHFIVQIIIFLKVGRINPSSYAASGLMMGLSTVPLGANNATPVRCGSEKWMLKSV